MDEPRKHQVSLRGASAKEISRDALLEKVSQERELRNYARRANAAALLIQRVWRRCDDTKKAALQLRNEWEVFLNHHVGLMTGEFISKNVVRPFIFFVTNLLCRHQKIQVKDIDCMKKCFEILLESTNSTDPRKNYCSLAMGPAEERKTWIQQAKKLIFICSFILPECDTSRAFGQKIIAVSLLAMRLIVVFTDLKGWKNVTNDNIQDADSAVKTLVQFMGSQESCFYLSIRKFINTLDVTFPSQVSSGIKTDDKFLITASAITLALRPILTTKFDVSESSPLEVHCASEQFFLSLLTIPWLVQRLPAVLITALRHKSALSLCFQTLLISRERILAEMLETDHLNRHPSSKIIPSVGWALANIICLATAGGNDICFQDLEYSSYVHVVIILSENLLVCLERVGWLKKDDDFSGDTEISVGESVDAIPSKKQIIHGSSELSYTDLLKPVCQQQHLKKLLSILKPETCALGAQGLPPQNLGCNCELKLLDIAYFYSYMLRLFSELNPMAGSLRILNMLSFTPGFLVTLWDALELSLFPSFSHCEVDTHICSSASSGKGKDRAYDKKQKQASKDGANKWVSVLNKITGKSQPSTDSLDEVESQNRPSCSDEVSYDAWDIESLRCGPQGLSKDMACLLHLFCATYAHLLLVLDDIEFYEKQVPFRLEQQRRIASVLNTLVYNGLSRTIHQQNRPLLDSAIRCLHLIYERDCRHKFCPPDLWLSPARNNRPPIAVAARNHEGFQATLKSNDAVAVPTMASFITTTPHVFPFDERVQMFREFIKMDRASRKMAGEVTGPGSRSIEIVVRRGHVVEDGFRQLNSIGSRLKSSIHVSFVSECGLPEAGLDYGGLSKEFLTDISKAAFSPEHGLFSQTSTSDRHLIPNAAARNLENGIQMIEFLGRIVGKALYEGILLDYSFSHVFVQKLLGRYSFLDELSTVDPELYKNLMYVKHYDGDVEELCLDFTVTEESFGKHRIIELKPGGKDITVTNENKMQYIHAVADYKLNRQILPFSNAFYGGLTDVISPSWLKLFNANEFNQLLSGGNQDIDVDDLRNNTRYTGGYSEGSRTIKLFWEVMKGFEPNERCLLLKFVTSCSRAPLLGFKYLQPTFTIHKVASDIPIWAAIGGQDINRLPSASTCYNTLKLPAYKRASTLRAKLLYAINSNAGFELS